MLPGVQLFLVPKAAVMANLYGIAQNEGSAPSAAKEDPNIKYAKYIKSPVTEKLKVQRLVSLATFQNLLKESKCQPQFAGSYNN